MKKRVFFATVIAFLMSAFVPLNAQNFKQSGSSAAALVIPKCTSLATAQGDLNKDGKKDLVIFANYEKYNSEDDFAVYFGDAQGKYSLYRSIRSDLPSDLELSITDKGVIRIESHLTDAVDVFLFRYQDGDFRLIGGKKDRHKTEHYDISYNFLTDKMIRTDGEGKAKKSVTSAMPKLPVLKLGWFPMNFNMLNYLFDENEEDRSMEYLTVMGIFRLMQANEMLFWHFCDYENPYRDPRGANGSYTADDELMKPACYNAFSTMSIDKQKDGSFLIDLSETFQDRTYEQKYNEDLSNIDEVEIPDNTESSTRTKWIFKDGKFTQISREE
ncbi:MAG: hypothetical protein IK032_03470 [Bacteroidales bacterium]|nr:hypothetical protein [Bacteroidales bacterium]